ncbi:putative neuralized [Danaus plexippus plexippus]|uniref:Protein neuralized n=1 Tax=Danaus plexippus plexippus TaxID=278856 RepID=A0A212F0Z7_DANPL|nr:putative neuralized [Danaus plexippus plexippus]
MVEGLGRRTFILTLAPQSGERRSVCRIHSLMCVCLFVAAPRSSCSGGAPNNLPPLSFHSVHGENVRVSRDGSTARRVESFCKGVAFSARPVRVNEKVCIRFVEISNSWSGVIRFGFTGHDPATLAHALPKYACPDLTNKPGNWAKALGERFCEKDNVLYYYVNSAGDVLFGVNGEDKGLFFSGVDTRSPLWALIDVYGNCTAVQFADPRAPGQPRRCAHTPVDDDSLVGGMRALAVDEALPPPRHQNPLVPLTLHRTRGRNVHYVNDRGIAARAEAEFCQGYVFTARPMRPGQTIVVQILATEAAYAGSLAIGLTSCDPALLTQDALPDDADQLLDRPEYWVLKRDAAAGLRRHDELAVTLSGDGEVRLARNGAPPATVMHVDHTLRLWAFVDIYGATQRVRLLSTAAAPSPSAQGSAPAVRVLGAAPGGTVLVVSLPPQQQQHQQQPLTLASAHYIEPLQSSQLCVSGLQQAAAPYRRDHCASSSQNSCNEQLTLPGGAAERLQPLQQLQPLPSTSRQYSMLEGNLTGAECTICFENPVDSVLYMCGHMCMCYRCAVQQWRGKGGGQCPLCRAQIKDVIRTYKS